MTNKTLITMVLAILGVCAGCSGSETGPGTAVAKVEDWTWNISGTCEFAGDDMTFTAPGDPLLSIGINSAGTPTAVGNLSSQSNSFISFIGHPNVEQPAVTINDRNFVVSGPFFIGLGVDVQGEISINCN